MAEMIETDVDTAIEAVKSVEEQDSNSLKNLELNKGAWTAEEDRKLAQAIEIYGPKRWKSIAAKAGLNRGGKSCRLRWMNYLRPNIKRGNISPQEEDLILRLHKLLGNRWSLIAGRLPGRTDNEIKNYWNSYLSKKVKQREKQVRVVHVQESYSQNKNEKEKNKNGEKEIIIMKETPKLSSTDEESEMINFDVDDFFDFSNENPSNLKWVSRFL